MDHIHLKICKYYGIPKPETLYKHKLKRIKGAKRAKPSF